jgi:hypothetical protein
VFSRRACGERKCDPTLAGHSSRTSARQAHNVAAFSGGVLHATGKTGENVCRALEDDGFSNGFGTTCTAKGRLLKWG